MFSLNPPRPKTCLERAAAAVLNRGRLPKRGSCGLVYFFHVSCINLLNCQQLQQALYLVKYCCGSTPQVLRATSSRPGRPWVSCFPCGDVGQTRLRGVPMTSGLFIFILINQGLLSVLSMVFRLVAIVSCLLCIKCIRPWTQNDAPPCFTLFS